MPELHAEWIRIIENAATIAECEVKPKQHVTAGVGTKSRL